MDLVILDLGLPRMDGIEVIRTARARALDTPILVLSARERAADRALGLDVGADDYLGKPFDTNELLARTRALLRRSAGRAQPALPAGALRLDPAGMSIRWHSRDLDLTRREFALVVAVDGAAWPAHRSRTHPAASLWMGRRRRQQCGARACTPAASQAVGSRDPHWSRHRLCIGRTGRTGGRGSAAGAAMNSIRRALLLALLGMLSLLMLAAAGFSYRAGLQEAGEMFDARLVQSARVLLSLVDQPLDDLRAGEPIVIRGWHGQAQGVGEALAFQVRNADGALLLRSDSAPAQPMAPLRAGYADVQLADGQWRTFTLRSPGGRWFQSAERADIREELAEDIALGTLLPLLMALPLMALLIWAVVNWAKRSLVRVSDDRRARPQASATAAAAAHAARSAWVGTCG